MNNLDSKLNDSYLNVRNYGIRKGLDITFRNDITTDNFEKHLDIDELSKEKIAELLNEHTVLMLDVLTDNYDFVYLLMDNFEAKDKTVEALKKCKIRRLIINGQAKPEFFRKDLEIDILDLIDNIKKEKRGFKKIWLGEI